MGTKTVKISEENYKTLYEYAGELQKKIGEPVSIDRTLSHLLRKGRLSELAGSWKMTDSEADELMKNLRKGWSKWKKKSA